MILLAQVGENMYYCAWWPNDCKYQVTKNMILPYVSILWIVSVSSYNIALHPFICCSFLVSFFTSQIVSNEFDYSLAGIRLCICHRDYVRQSFYYRFTLAKLGGHTYYTTVPQDINAMYKKNYKRCQAVDNWMEFAPIVYWFWGKMETLSNFPVDQCYSYVAS